MTMHRAMAATLDLAVEQIGTIQKAAREQGSTERPRSGR